MTVMLLKARGVNIRPAPSTNNRPIRVQYLPIFNILRVRAVDDEWAEFFVNDANAFVYAKFVQFVPDSAVLKPPYVSQLGADAPEANDCGQACVASLLHYYGAADSITVKALTDLVKGRTNAGALRRLAAQFDLHLTLFTLLNTVKTAINSGRPPIALVQYRQLGITARENPACRVDPGLHWVIVTAWIGGFVYIHDPLWMQTARGGAGGAYLPIPERNFTAAFAGSGVF